MVALMVLIGAAPKAAQDVTLSLSHEATSRQSGVPRTGGQNFECAIPA
jgi:hypothetical protein